MKSIDIDSIPPVRVLEELEKSKEWESMVGRACVDDARMERSFKNSRYDGAGINWRALLDWRRLERRYHELHVFHDGYFHAFWGSLRKAWQFAKEQGTPEVWIPLPGGFNTLVYDDGGLGTRQTDDLIKKAVPKSGFRPYITQGQETIDALRLKERMDTLGRRAATYKAAFQHAVEERLTPWVLEHRRVASNKYRLFHPAVFVLSNDDRHYVIEIDRDARLRWKDSDCEVISI